MRSTREGGAGHVESRSGNKSNSPETSRKSLSIKTGMKKAPKRTLITNGFNSRLYLKVIKETAACGEVR